MPPPRAPIKILNKKSKKCKKVAPPPPMHKSDRHTPLLP